MACQGHTQARCIAHSVCLVPQRVRSARGRPAFAPPQASVASVAALALAALPASVAVDALLDRAQDRVGRVATSTTPAGTRMYVAKPRGVSGRRPAVVLIHQIFGLQPREAGLCDDLAERGYVAVAPDTFDGAATSWIPRALVLAYPRVLAADATWGADAVADAVAWVKQQPDIDPDRVAVAGFCYGGGAAVRYAAAHPGAAAAVGVFYGRPLTPGKASTGGGAPAAASRGSAGADGGSSSGEDGSSGGDAYAALTGVPVFAVYGGRDSQFPASVVDGFEASLRSVGAPSTFRRYPDQGHAFIADAAAARKAGTDAADAWSAWADFLGTHLSD